MKDLAYAFTIFFVTLGPIKVLGPFFLVTHRENQRTILLLALKSTFVATAIALFVGAAVISTMAKWHVSIEAVAIAGGILLLISSIRTISGFNLIETPAPGTAIDEASLKGDARSTGSAVTMRWLGNPVLSPLAIPTIVTPIGVAAILCFADASIGDDDYKLKLTGVLLSVMALNFLAMVVARPLMRLLGLPILQTLGWVFSSLQAGLAMQLILGAFGRVDIIH